MLHVSEQSKSHEALRTSHNTMDGTDPKQPIPQACNLQHEPAHSQKQAKADKDRTWASQEHLHRWTSLQAILLSHSESLTASAYQEPVLLQEVASVESFLCLISTDYPTRDKRLITAHTHTRRVGYHLNYQL